MHSHIAVACVAYTNCGRGERRGDEATWVLDVEAGAGVEWGGVG